MLGSRQGGDDQGHWVAVTTKAEKDVMMVFDQYRSTGMTMREGLDAMLDTESPDNIKYQEIKGVLMPIILSAESSSATSVPVPT